MSNSNNKHRIIKNTLFLYFRMILTLVVTLYTSRVVLNTLGVEDFGIYNVVGGVVTMMAFLSGAMSSATQRFLSFELGKGDTKQLSNVFKMSVNIHLLIILFVVLVAETLGLWFVNYQLVIPVERLAAANWVFQCALFSFCCAVIGVPYNAAIIAYEKMKAFAYISIVDVTLKLSVAFLLQCQVGDKLQFYAILLSISNAVILLMYYIYARRQFTITKFKSYWDFQLFRNLLSYTSWSLFGNMAMVATSQGINILVNIYFGATTNAARAISFQVSSAMMGFVNSLQMSINPQIVKSYACENRDFMQLLIFSGAKYAFFLLYLLAFPFILNAEYFLKLWLVNPPHHATVFCQLILVDSLIISLSGGLIAAAQASGNIKLYQLVVGGVLLLNIPISYVFINLGAMPQVVFYVSICTSLLALFLRLLILKHIVGLDIKSYTYKVFFRIIPVVVVSNVLVYYFGVEKSNDFYHALLSVMLVVVSVMTSIIILGLDSNERKYIFDVTKTKIRSMR